MAALIGVTGGMGTGKSTVLEELKALGQSVIDSDTVVHQLYAPGSALSATIAARYGQHVLTTDGGIDRRVLSEIVFNSPSELAWLNRQVHPLVKRHLVEAAELSATAVFCAVPLLFEVGWESDMQRTVAVWCNRQTQMSRLRGRNWSRSEIEERLAHQISVETKMERADYVLINNGSRELLRTQIEILLRYLLSDA